MVIYSVVDSIRYLQLEPGASVLCITVESDTTTMGAIEDTHPNPDERFSTHCKFQ